VLHEDPDPGRGIDRRRQLRLEGARAVAAHAPQHRHAVRPRHARRRRLPGARVRARAHARPPARVRAAARGTCPCDRTRGERGAGGRARARRRAPRSQAREHHLEPAWAREGAGLRPRALPGLVHRDHVHAQDCGSGGTLRRHHAYMAPEQIPASVPTREPTSGRWRDHARDVRWRASFAGTDYSPAPL
jgi:hypothetical protein